MDDTTCRDCGFVARTVAGLGTHRRAKHPDGVTVPPTNAAALEETLEALAAAGRFEPVDAAQIRTLRSLAATVDADPFSAQLWRQYREALADLLKVDDDADDSFARAIAKVRGAAQMGDPPPA